MRNKLLKIELCLCLLIIPCIYSCNKVFHKEDLSYVLLDSQQKKIDLLNGMYSRLAKVHNRDYFIALIRSDDINVYSNAWGDPNCNCPGSILTINFDEIIGLIYKNLYTLIATANSLLPKLDTIQDRKIKGEVYFLRAYSYFKLARLFGNPPLVKDPDVCYSIKIPSYVQVYEFIEQDLLKALDLLPENPADARIPEETPHKGTVKALLAEVYLSWGGYPINDESKFDYAVQYAGDVIRNSDHYQFDLLYDISDLWTIKNRHNKENIFGLFYYKPAKDTSSGYLYQNEFENTINSYPGACSTLQPEFQFYMNFPDSYRKRCFYPVKPISYTPLNPSDSIYNPLKTPGVFIMDIFSFKWLDRNPIRTAIYRYNIQPWFWQGSSITLYLLRYAQTLLTYAEAKAKTGVLDESAYEAVNMVRRRAHHLDIHLPSKYDLSKNLNYGNFIDSVVWERAWELCFEPDGRWFDIIRLDLRKELYRTSYPYELIFKVPNKFLNDDFWYFYKIPEADRYIY